MAAVNQLDIEAVVSRAIAQHDLLPLSENVAQWHDLMQRNEAFGELMRLKAMPIPEKVGFMLSLPGFVASPTFEAFITVVLSEGWVSEWRVIHDRLQQRINRQLNRSVATVVSAVTLTDQQIDRLKQCMQAALSESGGLLDIRMVIDGSVIGGLRVTMPDGRVVDLTLLNELTQLKSYVTERG
ncbi:hypothetical protein EBZ35_02555 [bacterium]|nr:hypothetical protein [bacterium]